MGSEPVEHEGLPDVSDRDILTMVSNLTLTFGGWERVRDAIADVLALPALGGYDDSFGHGYGDALGMVRATLHHRLTHPRSALGVQEGGSDD